MAKTGLLRLADLHQRIVGVHWSNLFVQHLQRFVIPVLGRERCLHRSEKPFQRTESVIHRGSFISAMDHAIGALGIAGLVAVLVPFGLVHQLFEGSA